MRSHRARPSTTRRLLVLFLISASPVTLLPGARASSPESDDPLLTLDEAVSLALSGNREVTSADLEVQKSDDSVKVARSRRLPRFHVDALGGSLLEPFDFTFPKGSFGTYPGIGPVPSNDAKIRTPAQFTATVSAAIDQPLTQQHKISLGITASELGRDLAKETLRVARHKVRCEVRKAYFGLVAAQAAVTAARDAVTTLTEARRVTLEHEQQHTVLHADALEVEARLMKAQYDLSSAEHRLDTQREALNDLLGRDLDTPFRVEATPQPDAGELTLEAARTRAATGRPELRQAHVQKRLAEAERRLARAEYIPDLSLSVRYMGFNNFEVLPRNVTTAGLFLSWEPFDWRRRHNNVAQKGKAVEQAAIGAAQTKSRIAIEVGAAYRAWRESRLLVGASRTAHEAATEQLRVITEKYKEQAALIRDLLEAQARNAKASFDYEQALATYWAALAELSRVMGDE